MVNYCSSAHSLRCVKALFTLNDQPGCVLVVDNNSNAKAKKILETGLELICQKYGKTFKKVDETNGMQVAADLILIEAASNRGFSGGNNIGIRRALQSPGCNYVWLLNNDCEPKNGALAAMLEKLQSIPNAGVCGSSLVYADGKKRLQCAGGGAVSSFFGTTSFALEGTELIRLDQGINFERQVSLDFICGASMLLTRSVIKKIGLLPEEFFLYYEDVDYSFTARKAGYGLVWASRSIVYHKEGGTSGASSMRNRGPQVVRSKLIDYYSLRNRVYFMKRHFPRRIPIVLAGFAGVLFNRLRRRQYGRVWLALHAAWNGFTGNMLPPSHKYW